MFKKIFTSIFFLTVLFYLWYLHDKRLSLGDEGIMLLAAERVLKGEIIYKDFFDFITPGTVFTTSLFFRVLGVSYYTVEILSLLLAFLIAVFTYLVSKQIIKNFFLAFIPIVLFLITGPAGVALVGRHYWFSVIIILITLYLMLKKAPLFISGLFIGFGLIFSQSIGVFLLLGVLTFFLMETFLFQKKHRFRIVLRQWSHVTLGFLFPVLLLVGYFYKVGALSYFWYEIGPFSLNNYLAVNFIPPSFDFLFFWLIFVFSVLYSRTKKLLLLGIVSLFITLSSFYQFGQLQFLYLSAPLFIFATAMLEKSISESSKVGLALTRRLFSIFVILLTATFLLSCFILGNTFLGLYSKDPFKLLKTPRGNIWLYEPNWQREEWVFDLLNKEVLKDKKIVFLPFSPHLYFLSARPNPLRYQVIFPGFNNFKMHKEAVEDLTDYNPELIHFSLQEMSFTYDFENPVWNYITKNYDLLLSKEIAGDERINALFIRKDLKGSELESQLKAMVNHN